MRAVQDIPLQIIQNPSLHATLAEEMATKIADFTQQIADKEHALTLAEDKHSSESKALQNNIAELQGLRDKLNKELDELNLREEGFTYLEDFPKQDSFLLDASRKIFFSITQTPRRSS